MTNDEHIRRLGLLLCWAEGALHGGMCGESADRLRDMRRQLERETVDDDDDAVECESCDVRLSHDEAEYVTHEADSYWYCPKCYADMKAHAQQAEE